MNISEENVPGRGAQPYLANAMVGQRRSQESSGKRYQMQFVRKLAQCLFLELKQAREAERRVGRARKQD